MISEDNVNFVGFDARHNFQDQPKPRPTNLRPRSFFDLFRLLSKAPDEQTRIQILRDNTRPQLLDFHWATIHRRWLITAAKDYKLQRYREQGPMESILQRTDMYVLMDNPKRPSVLKGRPDRLRRKLEDIMSCLAGAEKDVLADAL